MKKISKRITVIGTAIIPTASIVACGAETTPGDTGLAVDEQAVNDKVTEIQGLAKTVNEKGQTVLPSTIINQVQLYENITEAPTETDGIKITATFKPENANDVAGTLTVEYTVTKGTASKPVTISYAGFSNIDKQAIEKQIVEMEGLDKTANTEGTKKLPSAIADNDQVELYANITAPPAANEGITITPTFTAAASANDVDGTLKVVYTIKKGKEEKQLAITYIGFRTTAQQNEVDVQTTISGITNGQATAEAIKAQFLPTDINNDQMLEGNVTNFPKADIAGVEIEIKENSIVGNNKSGTVSVVYEVSKLTSKSTIAIDYTGFWTTNDVITTNKINEINASLEGMASSTGANKLPEDVTLETLKTDIDKYPRVEPGASVVEIKSEIQLANNADGELTVVYTIEKGIGEKNSTNDDPLASHKSKPIVYKNFLTTLKNDQMIAEAYRNEIQNMGTELLPGAETTLPESIKVEDLNKYIKNYPATPTDGTTVTPKIDSANDDIGQLIVTFTVEKGNSGAFLAQMDYRGFYTKNEKALDDAIAKITNGTANTSGENVLPSTITTIEQLKANITNYPTPTDAGITIEIKPGDMTSSDVNGVLTVIYTLTKGEASKSTTEIEYTGFKTLSDADNEVAVSENITRIQGLSKSAKNPNSIFPSLITESDLYDNLLEPPTPTTKNVNIVITNMTPNDKRGELSVLYTLSKGKASQTIEIKYVDFKISSIQETSKLEVNGGDTSLNSVGGGFSQKIDDTHYWIGTTTGLKQIEYDPITGKATILTPPIQVLDNTSMTGAWSLLLDNTHYWVGTSTAIYTVTIDFTTKLITNVTENQVTVGQGTGFENGFAEKLDDTHYWIGTYGEGLFEVEVDANSKLITGAPTRYAGIPDVEKGWVQNIDPTHYWIGTSGLPYVVEINPNDKSIVSANEATTVYIDTYQSFIQKIDSTHYLIGTWDDGLYQVEVDPITKGIAETATRVDTKLIPVILANGWSQQIGERHYLIGSGAKDDEQATNGVYDVEVDINGKVTSAAPIATTGTGSDIFIPLANTGWAQKIDQTHYLIGTASSGIFKVTTNGT